MENNIIFKKVNFGGFDREDVMNYIAKITDDFHEDLERKSDELSKAKEKISTLEAELESVKEERSELSEKIARLESENEDLKNKNSRAAVSDDIVESETEQLRNAVKALTQKVDELISDSAEKNSTLENDSDDYDRDLFDLIEQYAD